MIIIVAHWWQSGIMLVACLSSYDHASISYEMYWMLIILKNGINESLYRINIICNKSLHVTV